MALRAQARRRLRRELRRLAGTLQRWTDETDDAAGTSAPGAPAPVAPAAGGPPEHWLATVREHAPELLADGGTGFSVDPGPRVWHPEPLARLAGPWLELPDVRPAPNGTGAPTVTSRGAAAVSPAAAPHNSGGAPGHGELAAGEVVAQAGRPPGAAAAPSVNPALRPTITPAPAVTSTPAGGAEPRTADLAPAIDAGAAPRPAPRHGDPVVSRGSAVPAWPGAAEPAPRYPVADARTSAGAPALALAPAPRPPAARAQQIAAPAPATTPTPGPEPAPAAATRAPAPSLVAMTVSALGPAAPPAPAAAPPWPALATDAERAPAPRAGATGPWPDLPDDREQRAWAPGLGRTDPDRAGRLEREQRGAR